MELQGKAQVKLYTGSRPALPRSEPIHFMSAEACTEVTDLIAMDGNFDNAQWCDSIEVSYNPANQSFSEKSPSRSNKQ